MSLFPNNRSTWPSMMTTRISDRHQVNRGDTFLPLPGARFVDRRAFGIERNCNRLVYYIKLVHGLHPHVFDPDNARAWTRLGHHIVRTNSSLKVGGPIPV